MMHKERKRPAIVKMVREQENDRCQDPPIPALIKGIEEFNTRRFFECHETLEDAWIEEDGPIRELYQGILQVGVGFYHLRRGNYAGACSLLERGTRLLGSFAPQCMGVDVERLIAEAREAHAALQALGPERMDQFNPGLIPYVHLSVPEPLQLREQQEG